MLTFLHFYDKIFMLDKLFCFTTMISSFKRMRGPPLGGGRKCRRHIEDMRIGRRRPSGDRRCYPQEGGAGECHKRGSLWLTRIDTAKGGPSHKIRRGRPRRGTYEHKPYANGHAKSGPRDIGRHVNCYDRVVLPVYLSVLWYTLTKSAGSSSLITSFTT